MSSPKLIILGVIAAGALTPQALAFDFGRPAIPDEIKLWDIKCDQTAKAC